MADRKYRVGMAIAFGVIGLGVVVVMLLCVTVLSGFRRDWFRMGLCLFLFLFTVFVYVGLFLDLKIHSCFKRLEDIIPRKSNSTPLGYQSLPMSVSIFLVLFGVVMVSVSLLAGLRQQWLTLCVLLTVFAVGNFIFMGVKIALNIRAYSKRLEELISKDRDDRAFTELPVEQ